MAEQILDGTGKGFRAKVDHRNRLITNSTIHNADENATLDGNSFNINTGIITLTDAVDTPVMYVKNNGDDVLIISLIVVGISPSAGASGGIPIITVVRNPTTGTLISNAINVDITSNRNYGSSKTLDVDAFKGATSDTMTNGDDHILAYQTVNGRAALEINEAIPKGSSIGIKVKPPTGNTSVDIYSALVLHITDFVL